MRHFVAMELLAAGVDIRTVAGRLSHAQPGRPAFVYDVMEPLRPVIERGTLDIISSHVFAPGDVLLTDRGACRLHPQMARAVAAAAELDGQVAEGVARIPRLLGVVAE
jgi:CRISPR/Cas system-associated endonuclease Cas1